MLSETRILPLPAFTDNYIWVIQHGHYAAVVDPGDAEPVLGYLARHQLTLCAILNTHHHADHTGGNLALLAQYPVPVYGPARESIPGLTHPLHENDTVSLPELALELSVIDVPGHTLGHIAYYGTDILLCGDTLFGCGCGRLFEGTPAQMLDSLSKLARLPAQTAVYCAHEYTLTNITFALTLEPNNLALQQRAHDEQLKRRNKQPTLPSNIGLELATNPFLRCNTPVLKTSAEHCLNQLLPDELAVFSAIRRLKNQF
jgi:hydroxyacylglutathione hydrolase